MPIHRSTARLIICSVILTACSASHPGAAPTSSVPATNKTTTTFSKPPPTARALDLARVTAFGFAPRAGTSPSDVLRALTPSLGQPTRDTGWYLTRSLSPEDCLGHQRQRVLRWGNLSYAFWESTAPNTVRFTLWGWSLGDTADQREPKPIIDRPAIAARTADGLGITTALTTLQRRYGARLQLADDHRTALLAGSNPVVISLKRGTVIGIQGRLSFC